MKRVFHRCVICLALNLALSVSLQAQWNFEETPTRESQDLHDVEVLSNGNVVVVGDGGIWLSVADGPFLRKKPLNKSEPAIGVAFCNENVGFVISYLTREPSDSNGVIYFTANAGKSWIHKYEEVIAEPIAIEAFGDNVWFSCLDNTLHISTDAGATWSSAKHGYNEPILDISFVSPTHGCAVGPYGLILETTNAGITWIEHETGSSAIVRGIDIDANGYGLAVGDNLVMYETRDGGQTWSNWSRLNVIYALDDPGEVDLGKIDVVNNWAVLCSRDRRRAWFIDTLDGWDSKLNSYDKWPIIENDGYTPRASTRLVAELDGASIYVYGEDGLLEFIPNNTKLDNRLRPNVEGTAQHQVFAAGACGEVHSFGHDGSVLTTIDGGVNWKYPKNLSFAFTCAAVAGNRVMVAHNNSVNDGYVVGTEDGWKTTIDLRAPDMKAIHTMCFASNTNGWLGSDSGIVYKTVTSGTTWRVRQAPVTSKIIDLEFLNASFGYALSASNELLVTSDGGDTWTITDGPVGKFISRIELTKNGDMFATGQGELHRRVAPLYQWETVVLDIPNGAEPIIRDIVVNNSGCGKFWVCVFF